MGLLDFSIYNDCGYYRGAPKAFTARRNPGLLMAFLSEVIIGPVEANLGYLASKGGVFYKIQADSEALKLLAPVQCLVSFQTYPNSNVAVVKVLAAKEA